MKAWALILGLAAGPAFAQDLPVRLPDGATWTMAVQRERERTRDGQAPQQSRISSTAELTWKARGEGGQITVRPLSATATGPAGEELNAQGLLKLPIVLGVDADLTPLSIENLDEVREGLDQAIGGVITDPRMAQGAKDMFAKLPPKHLAQVLLREMVLASLAQGSGLKVGQESSYRDVLPNPLGGPPISSVGRFRLDSYDAKAGRAVVLWDSAFDQASASESLRQSMAALAEHVAPEKAEEARQFFSQAKVDRRDSCRHEIDIATGLAAKATCSSTISITAQGQSASNVDRWTITQSVPKTTP